MIPMKNPDPQVDSDPTIVSPPTTPIKDVNRGPKRVVDTEVVGSKKQRIVNGDVQQAVEHQKLETETQEQTSSTQEHSSSQPQEEQNKVVVPPAIDSAATTLDSRRGSSSNEVEEEDGDDDSMEADQHLETTKKCVGIPPTIKSVATTQDAQRASSSNECEEKDGDDSSKEDDQQLQTPKKSVVVPPAIDSAATTLDSRRGSSSNEVEEEDGDDDSMEADQHLETTKKCVGIPPTIKSVATTQDAQRASSSNECEEKDGDDGSKEDDQQLQTPKKSPQGPVTSEATGSKTLFMSNLSLSIEEEDVKNFFKNVGEIAEVHFDIKDDRFAGQGHIEFTTSEAAQEALKLNNELLLDYPVRLDLGMERGGHRHPTATSHATESKTLYLGNLSFSIEEDDVRDFFKDVGEIADIRFAIRDDKFLGYGHIEFTTAEAALEALKLNNKVLLDRRVKLDLARVRGSSHSSMEKSNQKGWQAQGKTIYVKGFDSSDGFDNIRTALEKHFGKCGEISRMSIPKDYESGAPKGVAFIDFVESNAFTQALKLDGSEVGGIRITVEEARKRRGDGHERSGHEGRGSGGGWGRESRSGSGSDRDRISGCGRESGTGSGWGREDRISGWGGGTGSVGGWGRGSGGGWGRENGNGGGWGRESGSGGGWGRESGYRESGYVSRRSSGSGSGYGYGHGREGGYVSREGGYGYGRSGYGRGGWGGARVTKGWGGEIGSSSRVGRFGGSRP